MPDREKVISGLHCRGQDLMIDPPECDGCDYQIQLVNRMGCDFRKLCKDALALLKEQSKEIRALKLLVEWAEECDFGFDQFPDEYERYKDEIKDMKYIDGMIHVAKRTLEDHGAFEEGR